MLDIFKLTLVSEANMIVTSTATTNNVMSNVHIECSTDDMTFDTIDIIVLGMYRQDTLILL